MPPTQNRNILTIDRNQLHADLLAIEVAQPASPRWVELLSICPYNWTNRTLAESDETKKQIIPYLIVQWKGMFASYTRAGNEKRLNGMKSIGIGGHIEPLDAANSNFLFDIVRRGAARELEEEFGMTSAMHPGFDFLGIINEEYTNVGKVHLGLVFLCKPYLKPEPGEELVQLNWITLSEITDGDYELWSLLAVRLLHASTHSEN